MVRSLKYNAIATLVAVVMFVDACSFGSKASALQFALEAVIDGAIAATGIIAGLQAAGTISATDAQAVVTLATWVEDHANKTLTELASGDPLNVQLTKALDLWSDIPGVPSNIAGGAATAIKAILAAIEQLKMQLAAAKTTASVHALTKAQQVQIKAEISVRSADVKKKLAVLQNNLATSQK